MSDHRKDARKKLMAFTPVYELPSNSLLGYVGNLNLHGMMVVTEKPVETERETKVSIEFPSSLTEIVNTRFVVLARVAWCRQDANLQSYTVGFEFVNLSAAHAEAFGAILERYRFRHEGV